MTSPTIPTSVLTSMQGVPTRVLQDAEKYSSYCTMAYQMYATRLQNAYDPFYSKHGQASEAQRMMHQQAAAIAKHAGERSLDPRLDHISYNDDFSGMDLRQPTFYEGEVYFEPQAMARDIGRIYRGSEVVQSYADKAKKDDSIDIYTFEGVTGLAGEREGFPSTMGYVAYNKKTNEITVTFRGSRSGSAERGAIDGLFSGEGNPDWVTDMSLAGDLISRPEIIPHGKVAEGFSSTYLSCRPNILNIIAKIRKDNLGKPQPKLVATGHSLGGALATMMFIDTQKGLFGKELNRTLERVIGEKDSGFIKELMKNAECFAFSAPPVCDGEAVAQMEATDKFHRVYFENDGVVTGGNKTRMFKGAGAFSQKELLHDLRSKSDINLGEFNKSRFDPRHPFAAFGNPHELYLVDEELQRRLGKKDSEISRTWYTLDENMQITHAAKGVKPKNLDPQQAAFIASQFNYEYFLTSVLAMAQREAHAVGKNETAEAARETDLIKHIKRVGGLLSKINSCNDEKEFGELRVQLKKLVDEISGSIVGELTGKSNQEKGWMRFPRQVAEIVEAVGKFVWECLKAVLDVCKGVRDWFKEDKQVDQKAAQELNQSINRLERGCQNLMKLVVLPPLPEKLTQADGAKAYLKELSMGLAKFKEEFAEFGIQVGKMRRTAETEEILREAEKFIDGMDDCIEATQKYTDGLSEGAPTNGELYDKVAKTAYTLAQKSSGVKEMLSVARNRWQKGNYDPSVKEKLKSFAMRGTSFIFSAVNAVVRIGKGIIELGNTVYGILFRNRTRDYMKRNLGIFSRVLEETNFAAFKKARDNRKGVKAEVPSVQAIQSNLAKKVAEYGAEIKAEPRAAKKDASSEATA